MMRKNVLALAAVVLVALSACKPKDESKPMPVQTADSTQTMNAAAESYVKLVLALGEHDNGYVDSFYGPAKWADEVKAQKRSVEQILIDARALHAQIAAIARPSVEIEALRHDYLSRQLEALIARAEILGGKKLTFDEESKALYDAVAPTHDEAYFEKINAELEKELPPGKGTLTDRLEAFRKQFVIPSDKLDVVFKAALDGCRARTAPHIQLPADESFTVAYVKDKPWSGYNWYKGGHKSLIEVNTDLPIFIDRAIDLACHEGYPGHHVYNVLLEQKLVQERGWVEFTVYPLFSPQSLIAEGSANYGIDVAFPANERVEFEKANLFPLAGLDPAKAEQYYRLQELSAKAAYAGNEAARRYLNGEMTGEQAVAWLTKYALNSPERARQRLAFIDKYRSYVINYNLGKDLVREYVEKKSGGDPNKRWEVFMDLLSSPRLPSGL